MSESRPEAPADDPAGGADAPDLADSIREVRDAARAGLKEAGGTAKAFRALLAADVSLARSAFGRAMALTAVAVVFGASCWLLLMATLITVLSRQLGLPWSVSLLICALLSGGITLWAAWRADYYFDHTRMQATRRQLARLGIGELADSAPEPGSAESTRDAVERRLPDRDGDGNPLTPP